MNLGRAGAGGVLALADAALLPARARVRHAGKAVVETIAARARRAERFTGGTGGKREALRARAT